MIGLKINNQSVDLYGDESVTVALQVKSIQDISSVLTDYTYSFTVPATPQNNAIFQHFYNPAVEGIDLRYRQRASITVDGVPFRDGYIQLLDIAMELNSPRSYNITFTGGVVSFANIFGDDTLKNLDWTEYNGGKTSTQVHDGLDAGTSLYGNRMIYPLIQKSYENVGDKWTSAVLSQNVPYTDFYPAIQVKDILDRIQSWYGVTFISNFITSEAITKLYLWFKDVYDSSKFLLTPYGYPLPWENVQGDTRRYEDKYFVWDRPDGDQHVRFRWTLTPNNLTIPYTVTEEHIPSWGPRQRTSTTVTGVYNGSKEYDTRNSSIKKSIIYIQPSENLTFTWTSDCYTYEDQGDPYDYDANASSSGALGDYTKDFTYNVPNVKITDFFHALIRMFNMVMVHYHGNEYYFEPYDMWRSRGQVRDLTRFIDITSHSVGISAIPSEISLGYMTPNAAAGANFNSANGVPYGNIAVNTGGAGEKIGAEVPFENLIWDRLEGTSENLVAFACDSQGKETKNYMFFYWGENKGGANIRIQGESAITTYKMGGSFITNTGIAQRSLNFGSELNPFTAVEQQASLYKDYWENYLDAQLNRSQRRFMFEAVIDAVTIGELRLFDTIKLHDNYFYIDSYECDLLTRKTSFVLINKIQGEVIANRPAKPEITNIIR